MVSKVVGVGRVVPVGRVVHVLLGSMCVYVGVFDGPVGVVREEKAVPGPLLLVLFVLCITE